MKVGVIFAIYNCEEFVDDCLAPWLKLRESHDFILAATSGRFSVYKDLGIEEKNKGTIEKLSKKGLDFLVTTSGDNLVGEDSSRDMCLNYLKPHNCDLIWLVDGDEIYTEAQIRGILDFIDRNPEHEGFSIFLKNYAIDPPYFIPPWNRPSIYRNRIYGGIKRFYFDAFFEYEDNIHGINDIEIIQIPKYVALVDHYSWTNREATRDKIKYQNVRYSVYVRDGVTTDVPEGARCQYEFDDDGIYFSNSFHEIRDFSIPSIHEYPTSIVLPPLRCEYNRRDNKIELMSDYKLNGCTLVVKDLSNGNTYDRFDFSLDIGVRHWFIPSISEEALKSDSFTGYRIEVVMSGTVVHIENILTKVGIK